MSRVERAGEGSKAADLPLESARVGAREDAAIPAPPPSLAGVSIRDEHRSGGAPKSPLPAPPAPPTEGAPSPQRRRGERAHPDDRRTPRRLKLTREGKYYLGITLGVGFAAINTGNNLLYLMLGMLLALIVISGVMS